MKLGICQLNPTVGDFAGNRQRILSAILECRHQGAELVVLPELALCGYPPEDLLRRPGFVAAHDEALTQLAAEVPPDVPVLIGVVAANEELESGGRELVNAAALLEDGLARVVARKSLLPTYDIFDELRFFEPYRHPERNVLDLLGKKVGITICEDAWNDETFHDRRLYSVDPVACVVEAGAELIINISASPWAAGKDSFRAEMLAAAAKRHGVPIVLANQVGGNVGIQFDGGSLAVGPEGFADQPQHFCESVRVVDTEQAWNVELEPQDLVAMQHAAIVQGIADYGRKFGFDSALVGLSGGIDSALTAALAVDALGAAHVTGIAMPSTHSSSHSVEDAHHLAETLGIRLLEIPIAGLQDAFDSALSEVFAGTEPGPAEENLQSRARGALLMAYANKFGSMLLTTGNKSETAVGYATLYGDMCGALAPIADLWKTEVWAMSRWINRNGERIPQRSIDKPPSAELRPDQFDSDSLPEYEILDPVLRLLVEDDLPVLEVAEKTGVPVSEVAALYRRVQTNEFKRFQYAPTVRLTGRCWGGRRMPVSHRFLAEPPES